MLKSWKPWTYQYNGYHYNQTSKNGTIVWKLPIKNEWGGKLIEVASFKAGYVRNQNSGYSNYQLNKTRKVPPTKDYKWSSTERILIPIEIDRLEYLISYCLKNYFIKRANQVANGEFVHKWLHEDSIKNALAENCTPEVKVIVNGHRYNVI